jgi:hypothetical protein
MIYRSLNRMNKEMPSYKLDGAKLIVNRLSAQLKVRLGFMCDVSSLIILMIPIGI